MRATTYNTQIDRPQPLVDRFAHHFNHHRPHQALGDLTPAQYLQSHSPPPPPAASHIT
jgi:transposase InsO family protein